MVAFMMSLGNKIYAQLNESIFSFNYGLAPIGHDNIDFYNTDFKFGIPVKLKKGTLVNSVGFKNYGFNYTKDFSFSTTNISRLYDVNYSLKYIAPLAETWLLTTHAQVAIVSNLTNTISNNDLQLTGYMLVTKLLGADKKNEALTWGVSYSTIMGVPEVLPIISYTNQISDKFLFGLGFPETFVDYKINKISSIKSVFMVDGFYANLNNSVNINSTTHADKVSFTSTSLGLEYNYKMDDLWGINFKGGYAFTNRYKLLNNNDTEVFNFNTASKPYLSAGITFNIKKTKQNKL
ncbi:hypothetical protein APS56_01315 [Pseudalgibacter alginicilyticus]|uniref:DUF6268 domain-containing protein n=2 Tax=Pseudalgibacter alginicilyticus TaxID=1736674 RepID=A0A0P0CU62_9FLAO|nr:hypothetical protein APS56_01315 [Pseudalgibacter alginicilyticus]